MQTSSLCQFVDSGLRKVWHRRPSTHFSLARSVEGQTKPAADQLFSFFIHPLPPSSCYSRPVKGLNSTDFSLPLRRRKKSDTVQSLWLTGGTASELSARASFQHTVSDFLAFEKYQHFMSVPITFKLLKLENGMLVCIGFSSNPVTHKIL